MAKSFFVPKEVRELVNISYRQMQYWDKSCFISPSYRRRDRYRLYTFHDLTLLKYADRLRKKGVSIQGLRRRVRNLKDVFTKITWPFLETSVLTEEERILVFNESVLLDSYSAQLLKDNERYARELKDPSIAKPKKPAKLFDIYNITDLRATVDKLYHPDHPAL